MAADQENDGPGQADGAPRPAAPSAGNYAGMGLQFGGSIVLFAYAGYWLDQRLGTSPWLLLLLVFVGAGAAFYSMYRQLFGAKEKPGVDRR